MWLLDDSPELVKIYGALYRIGIFANYKGFYYIARAIELCAQQPERLQLITKWLYPEVAAYYHTTWQSVERSIRTVVAVAWKRNPDLISQMSLSSSLTRKPTPKQFLAALVQNISGD